MMLDFIRGNSPETMRISDKTHQTHLGNLAEAGFQRTKFVYWSNVGIAIINHPCLMVYTTHLWWLGGWFVIAIPTLGITMISATHDNIILGYKDGEHQVHWIHSPRTSPRYHSHCYCWFDTDDNRTFRYPQSLQWWSYSQRVISRHWWWTSTLTKTSCWCFNLLHFCSAFTPHDIIILLLLEGP